MDEHEERNLEYILKKERDLKCNMSWFGEKARRVKRRIAASHDFRDNNFRQKKAIVGHPRIVVYSCISGGYDDIYDPVVKPKNIDYILFSDVDGESSKVWKIKRIPECCRQESDVLTNRYIKMHPHLLFGDKQYDYAIYIDGNIKVFGDLTPLTANVGDVGIAFHRHALREDIGKELLSCIYAKKGNLSALTKQVRSYRKEGFPKNFGMVECNMIVTDLKNNKNIKIFDEWWKEFLRSGSMRDQISLPYIFWKLGYNIDDVATLGFNIYRNPKVRKMEHK